MIVIAAIVRIAKAIAEIPPIAELAERDMGYRSMWSVYKLMAIPARIAYSIMIDNTEKGSIDSTFSPEPVEGLNC